MEPYRNYRRMIVAAVAAGLVGGVVVQFLKTLPLNKHQSKGQDRDHIVLGGIAKGIIKINVDSRNHPYFNILGHVIRFLNHGNAFSRSTKLLSKKPTISS